MKPERILKLTNSQLGHVLSKLPMLKAFIKAVELEAMLALTHDPSALPAFKIVEGKSRRKWRDEEATIKKLVKAGFDVEDFAPRQLAGLGEIAKLLPPAKREAFIGANTTKPVGRPTLASATDPRRAINGNAALDFADEIDSEE